MPRGECQDKPVQLAIEEPGQNLTATPKGGSKVNIIRWPAISQLAMRDGILRISALSTRCLR